MSESKPLILLIEDDEQTRRFLKSSLSHKGWRIIESDNGKNGLAMIKSDNPDLVILDLGLPDMDGISVTKRLRQLSAIPVLVLSARSEEQNKIMALDAGADDYLTKPFGTGELHARLQALLRRINRMLPASEIFETGQLTVDLAQRKVFIAHNEVRITPIEFRLLGILIRQAGLVVTHRQMLQEVWGAEHINDQHYLRIYMGQLRHKLEANPARPRYLLTEVGVGYRLALNEDSLGGAQ
ncbi:MULTISPECIES: response regulator [Methylomonas]|uniref:Two-component system response regulator n=2 Tax=Methylomonas TaxID=416 RepID=A0A126T3W3_9GAMM|nr:MULTISPECIES: response regulator [Methylomonas]AMK76776.1 two-component system response regulator [Methylomonas denitrificans]OAH96350.1 DNA-binding response regulator [Methylomonas methanica]TCV75213.1 two-component system KDP operon response regulator KdpE [Methylomonas methanica]